MRAIITIPLVSLVVQGGGVWKLAVVEAGLFQSPIDFNGDSEIATEVGKVLGLAIHFGLMFATSCCSLLPQIRSLGMEKARGSWK